MGRPWRCADSYPAVWRDQEGVLATGKLVLGPYALRLEGKRRDGGLCRHEVAYAELAGVHVGREPGEKLNGRPTLVLEHASRPSVQIDLLGIGLLSALTELLAPLSAERSAPAERLAVVVPLRKHAVERARLLLAAGPPFDLDRSGLVRHEVFMGEREVVFLFEGQSVFEVGQQLVRDPGAWRAALDWRGLMAGPPRLARSVFVWPGDGGR
jgi:hypothetical protein